MLCAINVICCLLYLFIYSTYLTLFFITEEEEKEDSDSDSESGDGDAGCLSHENAVSASNSPSEHAPSNAAAAKRRAASMLAFVAFFLVFGTFVYPYLKSLVTPTHG